MRHIIGIDTGGTFTDCVVMDAEGRITRRRPRPLPTKFSEGEAGRPAHLRQRRDRAPGRRHQHHLLRLARLDHDRHQRAALLGPALRDRRHAAAHRVPARARGLHVRRPPCLGVDRARAGDGDLALPRLQHAQQAALLRSRGAASLDLVERDGTAWLACGRCGQPLCSARENYKLHCHRIDRPIQAANTLIGDPQRFIDDAVQFRQFCCPACAGLIENEVCRAQDPVLWDIELEMRSR